jgi:hypothetical protein
LVGLSYPTRYVVSGYVYILIVTCTLVHNGSVDVLIVICTLVHDVYCSITHLRFDHLGYPIADVLKTVLEYISTMRRRDGALFIYHEWEVEYNLILLYTIDTNESLPTCQFLALSYQTQRGSTHEVMILVLHSGHSWLVAMISSEQSTGQFTLTGL